jgi:hypothetical protein
MARGLFFIPTVAIFQVFSTLAILGLAHEQQAQYSLTIDQAMSARELRDSGVDALSPAQRPVLNTWLRNLTLYNPRVIVCSWPGI